MFKRISMKKINIPALIVTVIYPLFIAFLAIYYAYSYGLHAFEILCMVITYYVCNISVGIGLHRLWAHGTYKTNKWVESILAVISAATLQGPILAWASDHIVHHMYTDQEKDPHSALKFKNKLVGFLWSHMGWMIFNAHQKKEIDRRAIVKLGRNKVVLWQFKNYWKIAIFMNTVVPLIIGWAIGGTLMYAISAFIFMGAGRALQQQATFCVNSFVHIQRFGTKKYYYGTARDIWWMFPFLLGENYHNFHHAFANDYRNGHKWYHADGHKWIIALMAKVGLAKDLVVTSDVRIKSMASEVHRKYLINRLDSIEEATKHIQMTALEKLKDAEKVILGLKKNLRNISLEKFKVAEKIVFDLKENLRILSEKTVGILHYVKALKSGIHNLEEKIVLELIARYEKLQRFALKLDIAAITA